MDVYDALVLNFSQRASLECRLPISSRLFRILGLEFQNRLSFVLIKAHLQNYFSASSASSLVKLLNVNVNDFVATDSP